MKARITKDEKQRVLLENFEKQLKRQQIIGMSYGFRATAQVVYDKYKDYIGDKDKEEISNISEEDKTNLLNSIYDFVKQTCEANMENLYDTTMNLTNAFAKNKDTINNVISVVTTSEENNNSKE